jgi:type II secretory pathway pseudopilin PulG
MNVRLLRVFIAMGVGIVISSISIYVAWQNAGDAPAAWRDQSETRMFLREIDQGIILYQQQSNALPNSLEQLHAFTNNDNMYFLQNFIENNGGFIDAWHHPFIYSKEGTNFLVTSYGRDGKPGGRGPDADLTDKKPRPSETWPTFSQFLGNERFHGIIVSSIVCGILAGLLSFLTVRVPGLTRRGMTILALSLLATLLGTFFVTFIITAVHVPSGH